jgi:glyoxylase-like metal-dependent hydrolase (beta-lactamase superfamily II)
VEAPLVVDVRMHGRAEIAAAYVVRGARGTALVDTGPASSLPVTLAALAALGVESLDWIVLTHVHLDHAGAAGALAARFPAARIAVHPRGARHVADPTRLWAGVSAVYGDATEALWGRPEPIAPERVTAVEDGERVDLGDRGLRAIATPGHARHHHAWLDDATRDLFAGDAVGMQVGASELWRATTPPADFDPDAALASIERLRAAAPRRIWLGHFGAATAGGDAEAADAVLDAGAATLRAWVDAVTAHGPHGVAGWLAAREAGWPAADRERLDATSDPALDAAGVAGWLARE